jgi:hypothetical protein
MRKFVRLFSLLLGVSLVACGGKSVDEYPGGGDHPEGGGGAQGGAASAGSGGGGPRGGATGEAGRAGEGGSAGAPECTAYDDETGVYIPVWIINETAQILYLGPRMASCSSSPEFEVADGSGARLQTVTGCPGSCTVLRTSGAGGCPTICLQASAVELKPGEVIRTTWQGRYSVRASLPAHCSPYDVVGESSLECEQAKRATAGEFTFTAVAGSALDCSARATAPCESCVDQNEGGCRRRGALVTGAEHIAKATAFIGVQYGLSPISTKTLPPPDGSIGGSANSGAAPAPSPVELIFRE